MIPIQIAVLIFVFISSGYCGDTEEKIIKYKINNPPNQLSGIFSSITHEPSNKHEYNIEVGKPIAAKIIPTTSSRNFVPIHEPQQEETPSTPRPVLPRNQIIAKVAQYQTYSPLNINPPYTTLHRSKITISIPQTQVPSSDIKAQASQYQYYQYYNPGTPKFPSYIPAKNRKQFHYFVDELSSGEEISFPNHQESVIYNGHGGHSTQINLGNRDIPTSYSFRNGFNSLNSYGPKVSGTNSGQRTGKYLFVDEYGYPIKSNSDQFQFFQF